MPPFINHANLRNAFHFSEDYQSLNYIGSRAKWMNSEGVHANGM